METMDLETPWRLQAAARSGKTNTNTKYTCDTGQTRNKQLEQWVCDNEKCHVTEPSITFFEYKKNFHTLWNTVCHVPLQRSCRSQVSRPRGRSC